MLTFPRRSWREPTTRAGEILLSHNHIALLHGLYDRPNCTVRSYAEWMTASLPYVARFREYPSQSILSLATRTVHPNWVSRARRGRRIEVKLTERGRMIIERRLPARIRGWGLYLGLSAITPKRERFGRDTHPTPALPAALIREATEYAKLYGIPKVKPAAGTDVVLYATTTGLGRSFVLQTREELTLIGPRRWHAVWTQEAVYRNRIPHCYREVFEDYDPADILCYLRELRSANRDKELYCRTYAGRDFLSEEKLHEWLSEEIDLGQTDIDQPDLIQLIRKLSATYPKVKAAITHSDPLFWKHPDTGKSIGRVFLGAIDRSGNNEIVVTSCAALSCLQAHFDSLGLGVRIETRYVQPSNGALR